MSTHELMNQNNTPKEEGPKEAKGAPSTKRIKVEPEIVFVDSKGKVSKQPFDEYDTLTKLQKAIGGNIQGLPHKIKENGDIIMVYCGEEARYTLTKETCPKVIRFKDEFSLLPPLVVVQIDEDGEDIPLDNPDKVLHYCKNHVYETKEYDFIKAYDLKGMS